MTEKLTIAYGDPITAPFWEAAGRHELIIQHCPDCSSYQFYPRPFCLSCGSNKMEWVKAAGAGVIYSMTTVRIQIAPEFTPPYIAAVIQLDEGPRLLTNIIGGECKIGDRVRLTWKARTDAPPLPVFEPAH